jgi:hypothetical protein
MAKPWGELRNGLRERLLHAGVAPRHVRRYLTELAEHWDDLRLEGLQQGLSAAQAEQAASERLGSIETLTAALVTQPKVHALAARAPLATFGAMPVLGLVAAYTLALLILWSGWRMFKPGLDSPFVPVHGEGLAYFGVGRLLFFGGPIAIGIIFSLVAARQRLRWVWPSLTALLISFVSASTRVHAYRAAGTEHVGLSLGSAPLMPSGPFLPDPLAWCFSSEPTWVLLLFTLAVLPYAVYRIGGTSALAQ